MKTLNAIIYLIRCLPEIIKLVETIDKRIKDQKLNNKIHEDINKIQKAFETQDAEALKSIFIN